VRREIRFRLNGEAVSAQVAPHESLVEMLREAFGLYGARESCGQGLCGCCTVLVDGTAVSGCLYLGILAQDTEVQTIEAGKALDAVQEAFIETSAFQCGFCTPGFVMASLALLRDNPSPDEAEVREELSGNICRCSGYQTIVEGVLLAAERGRRDSA
jgi:aerobic carbon-monoxide dehydrogenase small subunit